ncbi:MAG: hydrogenase maturation nickel metallochaperone HypA [Lachnospiraceae bacterium]|nr:hydrogenase maturation nickel metallochaperone HypA [Lachnospiraceae bacterium]
MHEMSYCISIVNMAVAAAKENELKTVEKISVEVGEMTGVLPYYLNLYFPEAAKGTILEGCELEIIEVPVTLVCADCNKTYHPDKEHAYNCPDCGSHKGKLIAGRDVSLRNICGE